MPLRLQRPCEAQANLSNPVNFAGKPAEAPPFDDTGKPVGGSTNRCAEIDARASSCRPGLEEQLAVWHVFVADRAEIKLQAAAVRDREALPLQCDLHDAVTGRGRRLSARPLRPERDVKQTTVIVSNPSPHDPHDTGRATVRRLLLCRGQSADDDRWCTSPSGERITHKLQRGEVPDAIAKRLTMMITGATTSRI